jgi:ATP-dependent DNA helicase RecG
LDKIQKKQTITEQEINRLRELKLIAGWIPNIQIIAEDRPKNIPYSEYKKLILNYIKEKGSATRENIETLIMPSLPFDMPIDKKQRKISNITAKLATAGKIKNQSVSTKSSVWVLAE